MLIALNPGNLIFPFIKDAYISNTEQEIPQRDQYLMKFWA